MRITNGIINNNTKSNILVNKEYSDKYNTMVATGQKITRPSDDPIVAIRALRLNNNISEINQYHGKNIPDAEAWLEITETALMQTQSVLEDAQKYLVDGASDEKTAEDRKNILENLKALRDQIYASGNSDYAGRTVFTGYRTGESLTFMKNETQKFTIVENFTSDDYEEITYVAGSRNYDPENMGTYNPNNYNQTDVESVKVSRLRLAYDNLMSTQTDLNGRKIYGTNVLGTDINGNPITQTTYMRVRLKDGTYINASVDVKPLSTDKAYNDSIYTNVGSRSVTLIPDTGELILGSEIADAMRKEGSTTTFEYAKESWEKNDPRPEHYFAAKTYDADQQREISYNYDDYGRPAFENQKISYEIAYNQKIEINTNADEVYKTAIGRDVDELVEVTQNCQDAYEKYQKLASLQGNYAYDQTKINALTEAAKKEYELYKEKMQKMFSHGIDVFKGYTDDLNNKIAAVGSLSARLELTKSRVSDQLENFKELADENINVELTESAIDLKNAELALEAAQQAAAKVAKASLLNYL